MAYIGKTIKLSTRDRKTPYHYMLWDCVEDKVIVEAVSLWMAKEEMLRLITEEGVHPDNLIIAKMIIRAELTDYPEAENYYEMIPYHSYLQGV